MSGNLIQQDPSRGFKMWSIDEIYDPDTNPNGVVPNVNDAVMHWARSNHPMRVVDVYPDGTSLIEANTAPEEENLDLYEKLFGYGPGDSSSSARAYIDTSVTPHRLAVDASVHFYGDEKKEVKIFKGSEIDNPATIVSAVYDSSLNYVSDTIPLQLVARQDVNNLAVKSVKEAHCSQTLVDGDLLTLVVYNSSGTVSKTKELVVRVSSFIVPAEAPVNQVTQIELVSPFMSPVEPDCLDVPINVPISSLSVMSRIHYSDRIMDKSIDGAKIQLHGAENRISTVVGEESSLVLTYNLSPNETSVDTSNGVNKHISRLYRIRSTVVEGSYSVKLYVAPRWVDEFVGYTLDYYLYDLDRGDFHPVTQFVEAGVNAQSFDGLKYNELQRLSVAIELDRVDARLKSYRHVQNFGISLMDDGLSRNTGWLIRYDLTKGNEYGRDLACYATMMSIGSWNLDITCGYTNFEEWIEAIYYDTLPLFDTRNESKAPLPTHFVLELNGLRTEYELSAWNDTLVSATGGLQGKCAVLAWKRKVGGTVLNLGCSPLRILHNAT